MSDYTKPVSERTTGSSSVYSSRARTPIDYTKPVSERNTLNIKE